MSSLLGMSFLVSIALGVPVDYRYPEYDNPIAFKAEAKVYWMGRNEGVFSGVEHQSIADDGFNFDRNMFNGHKDDVNVIWVIGLEQEF